MVNSVQGLTSGSKVGQLGGTFGLANIAAQRGAFGSSSPTAGGVLGTASGLLSLYGGLKQGGVSGYGGAAVGALRAGSGVAGLAGNQALSGMLGSAAGYVAAPLAVYNAVKNYKSGATGSDTVQGAEAGAAIGSVVPVIGTAVGAIGGAIVGALSSAFGGGQTDPENANWNNFVGAYNKLNPTQQGQMLSQVPPSASYQLLAGVMDAKNNSSGHAEELEQAFGKAGEGAFMSQMSSTVNSALNSGKIPKTASPQQIYSQVVVPWLKSKGVTVGQDSSNVQGAVVTGGGKEGSAMQGIITNLIGQWQSGDFNNKTPMGVAGQPITGLQAYAA